MKNILLIIPNMNFGGAQRSFSKLSLALSETGLYRVTNIIFNDNEGIAYPLGGNIINLSIKGGGKLYNKIFNFYSRIKMIRDIKKKNKIDVSISFLEGADFVNILSQQSEKVILSIRGSKLSDETINGPIGWIRKKILIPYLYNKADTITCVNNGIISELNNHFNLKNIKKQVIYNAYDINEIILAGNKPIEDIYSFLTKEKYLIFSGRLAKEKGVDHLIAIYHKIIHNDKIRFVIVGDGPIRKELNKLCKQLQIPFFDIASTEKTSIETAKIIFVGEQTNPHQFVSRASFFLMASSSEGFPNAMAEAMALGIPIISTDCPWGPREILSCQASNGPMPEFADYGILMPMLNNRLGNTSAITIWADLLNNVLKDENISISYKSKSLLRARDFSPEKQLSEWIKTISE